MTPCLVEMAEPGKTKRRLYSKEEEAVLSRKRTRPLYDIDSPMGGSSSFDDECFYEETNDRY